MKKVNRVKITHTNDQWERINEALTRGGAKNIEAHITRELARIERVVETLVPASDCEDCRQRKQMIFWLNDSSTEIVEKLKDKTGISEGSSIISRFIITPLLLKCC